MLEEGQDSFELFDTETHGGVIQQLSPLELRRQNRHICLNRIPGDKRREAVIRAYKRRCYKRQANASDCTSEE